MSSVAEKNIQKAQEELKKAQKAVKKAQKELADLTPGLAKLKELGLDEFEFKSIGMKMSELVLLSNKERGKKAKNITKKEWDELLQGLDKWDSSDLSAYLNGKDESYLQLE